MKRIVIDYKVPWLYPRAGIAGFFNPLLEGIVERHPEMEFLLVAPGRFPEICAGRANCSPYFLGDLSKLSRLQYLRYSLATFPAFVAQSGADLVLSPYYDFLIPDKFYGKVLLTVHDLCFLDIPAHYPFWTRWLHSWLLNINLPRAGGVLTVSEYSRSRLLAHFPFLADGWGPQVVYNSYSPLSDDTEGVESPRELRQRLGLRPENRVVLYTGGIDVRKNLSALLSGFSELLRTTSAILVITGDSAHGGSLLKLVQRYGITGKVMLTGPLGEREMSLLYRYIADCCISVSLYEGGARSAIEARAYSLPFVSSPLASVREMVGEYPLYCDPTSPRDIGEKLLVALAMPRVLTTPWVDERLSLARNVAKISELIEEAIAR